MEVVPVNLDYDLDTIHSWWEAHGTEVDLGKVLSDRGLIVPGVCAAWLYLSDGPMAWIGWSVANPHASPREVHDGFELIFNEFKDEAAEAGNPVVGAFTATSGLIKVFERAGFVAGDRDMTSLFFIGV